MTAVLRGSRALRVSTRVVFVRAGQCLLIPGGLVHHGLPLFDASTCCINAYSQRIDLGGDVTIVDFERPVDDIVAPEQFFALIEEKFRDGASSTQRNARTGLHLIEAGLAQGSMAEIANRLDVSREHFSRSFRRAAGMAPQAYRTVHRLNEGRMRLGTADSIAGIASDLGFADQSHFGRLFRQIFGVTPLTYRRAMR
ncbi:helix-turn-helix transcriptional regulator [Paraburkholderia fungorum]|uniref:helix-turn-helix transcriptional regulator n=1 Tax=Paraburkholderia fungorum TaxID=134537 RepID=UPI0038BBEFEA